mmetsp:Transcript_961/g.2571  ORF Transcript_961/g.2571 Transcript_961/m.2571 type:complete len:390 (+) Transcript_961:693-1862(+)
MVAPEDKRRAEGEQAGREVDRQAHEHVVAGGHLHAQRDVEHEAHAEDAHAQAQRGGGLGEGDGGGRVQRRVLEREPQAQPRAGRAADAYVFQQRQHVLDAHQSGGTRQVHVRHLECLCLCEPPQRASLLRVAKDRHTTGSRPPVRAEEGWQHRPRHHATQTPEDVGELQDRGGARSGLLAPPLAPPPHVCHAYERCFGVQLVGAGQRGGGGLVLARQRGLDEQARHVERERVAGAAARCQAGLDLPQQPVPAEHLFEVRPARVKHIGPEEDSRVPVRVREHQLHRHALRQVQRAPTGGAHGKPVAWGEGGDGEDGRVEAGALVQEGNRVSAPEWHHARRRRADPLDRVQRQVGGAVPPREEKTVRQLRGEHPPVQPLLLANGQHACARR